MLIKIRILLDLRWAKSAISRMSRMVQGVCFRRGQVQLNPEVVLHPWQTDSLLSGCIQVILANHVPTRLSGPEGWEVWQQNARVLISDPRQRN